MAQVATHPTGEELAAFAAGRLPSARQRVLERHIEQCGECCRRLEALPEDTLVERLRTPHDELPTPSLPEPPTRRMAALDESIPPQLVDHPRYKIARSIGGGGMGQVFLAEHRIMERPVVLKIVRRELLADPFAVKRFRIEVKAAAQLSHPNIVHAHDADQADDLHFLVMEFVDGTSLSKAVARHGPLPLVNACNYVRQAAQGLAHAHEKGMVHRDIKPQNLMLTPAGQVKILDFGLAQFARDAALHDPSTASPATSEHSGTIVTEAGTVFGTPDYMAPEQAKSARDVDIRADIYSLGCTLYFLLTGKPPFPSGTSLEKIAAHRTRPLPELAGTRDPIPTELAAVLLKLTAKAPEDRYANPSEVALALAPFARSTKSKTATSGSTGGLPAGASTAASGTAGGAPAGANRAEGAAAFESGFPPAAPIVAVDTSRSQRRPPSEKRFPVRAMSAALSVIVLGGLATAWGIGAFDPAEQSPPAAAPQTAVAPVPARRTAVLIFLPAAFSSRDFYDVRDALAAADVDIRIAGCDICRPMDAGYQKPITPDFKLPGKQPRIDEFDALYIPGGNMAPYKNPVMGGNEIASLIQEFALAGKPVAALGMGQGMFAVHGTLRGRSGSPNKEVAKIFGSYIGRPQPTPVTVDGPFITAVDDTAGRELVDTLLAEIRRRRPNSPASP